MSLFQPTKDSFKTLPKNPKTILITGGASGIGLTTATLLSSLNPSHNLVLLDLHAPPPTFTHPASHLLIHQCDITSWPAQRAAFETAYKRFGRIDHVFVNAGISESGDQFFTDALDADGNLAPPNHRVLNVDLNAAAETTKLAIHYLRKNGVQGGAIVLTASLAGYLGTAGMHMYSAAKHGVVGLMRSLKHECAGLNIAISVVAPAITLTPLILATDSSMVKMPEGRMSAEEHARELRQAGVTVNRVESVALAVCGLLDEGMKGAGKGVFVQNDRFWDLEKGLATSREAWMSREMLDDFRGGSKADTFKGGKAKI